MPTTGKGVFYPDATFTFPPGFSGEGGAFQMMAESVDAALTQSTVELIATYSNTEAENSSSFNDIPSTYEHLYLVWAGRMSDDAATGSSTGFESVLLRFNGDSGANYYTNRRAWDTAGAVVNASGFTGNGQGSLGMVGTQASYGVITVPRYTRAIAKDVHASGTARANNGQLAGHHRQTWGQGIWSSTATVTSIRWWPSGFNWAPGMRASLFGTPRS